MSATGVNRLVQRPAGFILAVWLSILAAGSAGAQGGSNAYAPPAVKSVGQQAPDFTLQDFKGGNFILSSSMKGKAVVLWFTNLCEGCQSSIPDMERLKSQYEKKGVEFVAVSVLGRDRKTVESVMTRHKVSFRFLYDPDGKATASYAGRFVEATCPLKNIYIIRKGGEIAFMSHLPGVDEKILAGQIENAAGQKTR